MKKQRITAIGARILACALTATCVMGGNVLVALADSAGQITVDNAKVRSDASTDASTLSTLANGTQVTVTDEKSDSSGNIWYHVTLSDGTTGYVRSDLMSVTAMAGESADEPAALDSDTVNDALGADTGSTTGGIDISVIANPEDVTPQDLQNATINVNIGKVRANASTNDDIVAQISQGTNVVISGSKMGSDSKTWYYVTFLDGGSQKSGYVRSDLVDMGDVIIVSAPEPEPSEVVEEQPVEEPAINNDYELVYTDDGTGTNVWWLYNHIDNTREKLQELLDYADSQASKTQKLTSDNQKLKIVSIVLGALLAIALVAVVILAIKLNAGGYEYEEDDDDDDDDDEDTRRSSRRSSQASRDRERERERERERSSSRERRYEEDEEDDDDDDDEDDDVRTEAPRKKSKPKNFMLDDDDFEFEFLNVDDK